MYYRAFYKGKQLDVESENSYAAQTQAALLFRAKKTYQVTVMLLADVEGKPVVHSTVEL